MYQRIVKVKSKANALRDCKVDPVIKMYATCPGSLDLCEFTTNLFYYLKMGYFQLGIYAQSSKEENLQNSTLLFRQKNSNILLIVASMKVEREPLKYWSSLRKT